MTIVVMPSCLGTSGLVRTVAKPMPATWAPLVHTFWPLTSQPPSTRVALRLDAGRVGAGVGLAEQLAPDDLLVERRRHPALRPGRRCACWMSVRMTQPVMP